MLTALLKYPKKSHRKNINFPPDSAQLAEFMGIEFGDGGIGNIWQIIISLNSISDIVYAEYITNLGLSLFGLMPRLRKRPNQNTLVVVYSSTHLVDFIVSKGAVRGNKIAEQINIPEWIKQDPEYEKAFVRGLIDTDGCLYIHEHTIKNVPYRNLGLCFTSFSNNLVTSIANIFTKNGIKPYITNKNRCIYLYSYKSVLKYLSIFGSSNPRILEKYKQWRGRLVGL